MSENPVAIRRLAAGDAEIYRAFRLYSLARFPAAFTSHVEDEKLKPLAWYEQRVAPQATPAKFMLGAFADTRLVGAVGLAREERRAEAHKANVFGMAVDEAFQRRGIGAALLRALIDQAKSLPGLRQLTLSVTEGQQEARKLYERLGFQTYGVEPAANIVNGTTLDKRLMILLLS